MVVITGVSKGIGRAVALRYARAGWQVVGCARGLDALAATAHDVQAASPDPTIPHDFRSVDLGSKEQVVAFAEHIRTTWPTPEVLVNNAGIYVPGTIAEESDETYERLVALNVDSVYYLTKRLLPAFMAARRGHIVMLNSTAGLQAYPNGGSYCLTKYALAGLTAVLREELKPHGVGVHSIHPGATLTDSWAGVPVSAERLMPPEDVAELIYTLTQLSSRTVVESIVLRPQLGDLG